MDDVEVESSADLIQALPCKILNMEAVEVASSESIRPPETTTEQLAMAAVEVASSESDRPPQTNTEQSATAAVEKQSKAGRFQTSDLIIGEVESAELCNSQQAAARKPKSQNRVAAIPHRHKDISETVDFEEDFIDESSDRLAKESQDEKIELARKSFASKYS